MQRSVACLAAWVDAVSRGLLFLSFTAMLGVALVQVLFRYVLRVTFQGSEEFLTFDFVWISFLGAALAYRERGHMAVDMVVDHLPAPWAHAVRRGAHVLSAVFFTTAGVMGWKLSAFTWQQISPGMQISMRWPYLALAIGSLAAALQALDQLVQGEEAARELADYD